jgi:uncharacterized membrane protein YagU involved in acid resistance
MKGTQLISGAVAGLVATVPMTVAMGMLYRLLPREEQGPLPPQQITDALAHRAGARDGVDETTVGRAAIVNHLGFGAATGAAFGMVAPRVPMATPVSGILFALTVWTVSYAGWIPKAGLMPHANEQPAGRNALMIASHVVWGASMGMLLAALQRGQRAA